ncbi:hypothetical protein [Frankia sp. Cppng1_Ct_nod]|uniref:hypothetical protein n=1 Tax=Frankia sp. Cppng1_Ct_nod TaxID=2897162 RepID=UPI001040FC1D|nr:hypothetical protein [Frankia sp. Cppng1_Ct_nod]
MVQFSTHQPSEHRAGTRRAAHQVGLSDPASTALAGPGSTQVSCLLMQDAVAAKVLSAAQGANPGILTGKVALFANPFLDGKEEALVVDTNDRLTYLQRSPTETSWLQVLVTDSTGVLKADEVVVVVHPRDLTIWAIYTPGKGGPPEALKLVATTKDGVTSCSWQSLPDMITGGLGYPVVGLSKISVSYDARTPWITGIDTSTGRVVAVSAMMSGISWFSCVAYGTSFTTQGPVSELAGGRAGVRPSRKGGNAFSPLCYLRIGNRLVRYDPATEDPQTIATDVSRIVGVFRSYSVPDVGCVYLDTAGNLITVNFYQGGFPSPYPVTSTTPGLGFVTASSWVDVNQMLHVYGIDAADTLKVLHQVSWAAKGIPVWSRSRVENPAAGTVTVPSCVGLVPKVAAFALDPFPDELPNQLVKLADTASPDEQVSFYTQDITSARWSRDKVRLPSTGDPQKVTHYVSSVTVLDRRGTAMPLLPVKVSAETLAEIQVDGASYLVGPGHSASLATNAFGRITIATPADSLLPATLHVDAVGLRNGAVIQPAAAVHDYLGGTGTLPSQQGLFDEEALKKAKIVEPGHEDSIHAVVTHSKQVFALADGKPLVSHLFTGAGPAPGIHGFAVGPTPGAHLGQGPHPVVYREFDTPEALAAHLDAIQALPQYGGVWEDFANWAGDVWQGIKNGAIRVYDVAVGAVTTVFIWVGEKILRLVNFVINTVETAVRAVEAVFRQVVETVGKVVDWLKSLFAFKDIWETKQALTDGMKTIMSYGAATIEHFGGVADGWFQTKEAEVTRYLNELKVQYAGRPLGDAGNRVPALTDASGHGLTASDLRGNSTARGRSPTRQYSRPGTPS